jgi:hypothetical protein
VTGVNEDKQIASSPLNQTSRFLLAKTFDMSDMSDMTRLAGD